MRKDAARDKRRTRDHVSAIIAAYYTYISAHIVFQLNATFVNVYKISVYSTLEPPYIFAMAAAATATKSIRLLYIYKIYITQIPRIIYSICTREATQIVFVFTVLWYGVSKSNKIHYLPIYIYYTINNCFWDFAIV